MVCIARPRLENRGVMNRIEQLQEIRRDGKIIEETMTPEAMNRAGWTPEKILALRWVWCGASVELRSQFGFLNRVVASRDYLVVLEDTDAEGQLTTLSVYRGDGTKYMTFQNVIPFAGESEPGRFASFRSPQSDLPTAFSVLFDVFRLDTRYQVEIDAASGSFIEVQQLVYPF